MVPWSRRVSYASECSFIFLSVCSGQIIMYLLSIPTIGSWWSQWVVMAVHHCYLWARWWCDTLGVTLHKVMNSIWQLSKTGTDPQRLSGWFLGFIIVILKKLNKWLWYIVTFLKISQKFEVKIVQICANFHLKMRKKSRLQISYKENVWKVSPFAKSVPAIERCLQLVLCLTFPAITSTIDGRGWRNQIFLSKQMGLEFKGYLVLINTFVLGSN
jgi:hypothetical protein